MSVVRDKNAGLFFQPFFQRFIRVNYLRSEKYVNQKDHKIWGNCGNIEDDYIKEVTGTYWISEYDGSKGKWHEIFPYFVKRMNEMDDSEQSTKDRKWVVEWYFKTFGTFGIKYNFQEGISEYLYEIRNEDVA